MGKTLADSCFGNVLSKDLLPDCVYEHRASNQIIYTYVPKDMAFFFIMAYFAVLLLYHRIRMEMGSFVWTMGLGEHSQINKVESEAVRTILPLELAFRWF